MESKQPDAISRFACIGSVSFVLLRVVWDIACAEWVHFFNYCLALIAICMVVAGPVDDENQEPPEP